MNLIWLRAKWDPLAANSLTLFAKLNQVKTGDSAMQLHAQRCRYTATDADTNAHCE